MFPSDDPIRNFPAFSLGSSAISSSMSPSMSTSTGSLSNASPRILPGVSPRVSPRTVIRGGMQRSLSGEQGQNLQQVANVADATDRLAGSLFYEYIVVYDKDAHGNYTPRIALSATRKPIEFPQFSRNPFEQKVERLVSRLHQWATDQSVNPDIQRERADVCRQLSAQLNPWVQPYVDCKMVLTSKELPSFLFKAKFIQNRLTHLTIGNDVIESGILELQEMKILKYLRALEIEGEGVKQIPESIGTLHQLSEIKISNTNIASLPESIGHLIDLNALSLEDNKKLICLPKSLVRLRKLQKLSLNGCIALQNLPDASPNPLHATDASYRFGKLRALESLFLINCEALKKFLNPFVS